MSIKLDWEIQAEKESIRGVGEDPDARRRRRQARMRFVFLLLILLALVGGAVAAVWLRLRQADWQIEQLLRDTVDAEVAALRIGDRAAFLNMQRSATDEWTQRQSAEFDRYQTLKLSQEVNLTGRIVSAEVERFRGRVMVEEIIGGVPYGRVWFYWRYEDDGGDPDDLRDGWRHVPPDYTFWGTVSTLSAGSVEVRYRTVDADVARAMIETLPSWLEQGCMALACPETPALMVALEPDPLLQVSWSPVDPWLLRVRSPFVVVGRLDQPFDRALQVEAARPIAERLVQTARDFTPNPTSDAAFLHEGIVSWLLGRFAQVDAGSYLIDSLARRYGDASVGVLLQTLAPDARIDALASAVGVPLAGLSVDWRDFLTWRLALEGELIARGDQAAFAALYDTSDEFGRTLAASRFAAGAVGQARTVVSVTSGVDVNGLPLLRAIAQAEDGSQEEIPFRLSGGVWRRAG